MSGKTFYFTALYCKRSAAFFFVFRHELNSDVKFFTVHHVKSKMIINGVVQFKVQKTEKKARVYLSKNGITIKCLRSVSQDLPCLLIKMKHNEVELTDDIFWHEFGMLNIGGGYREYKHIVNEAYDVFMLIKQKKLMSHYQIQNSRMGNHMLDVLKLEHM